MQLLKQHVHTVSIQQQRASACSPCCNLQSSMHQAAFTPCMPASTSRKNPNTSQRRSIRPVAANATEVAAPPDLSLLFAQAPPGYRPAPAGTISSLPPAARMGPTMHTDAAEQGEGEVSVRVWSPHAANVTLLIKDHEMSVPMQREGDTWAVRVAPGVLNKGDAYQLAVYTHDGRAFTRRDPWARATDYSSNWCFLDDGGASFPWQATKEWQLPAFEQYSIYELQVGSFTPEGTLAAATAKLDHISQLGFTSVQLMPVCEFSDAWGYNPRQLLSLHGGYGSPDELRAFVDRAHELGLAVIIDVVLHHGAVEGNALWEWDGWSPSFGHGGIFHEGGADTQWGRGFAFWKREVRDMLYDACAMWFNDYKCDGLRFDSANDLPRDIVQELTWRLHETHPGRFLIAEVTPENPMAVQECGLDSVWVHSGYFDIIQQHRALGRGHHGGGDWAAGWNLPRLRTVMVLHYGFNTPTQCVKYLLGSHDQIGCRNGGAWYKDYEMIGGQHRYPVDQFGAGRNDKHATSCARLWWTANVVAAGIPMMFMGCEWHQGGWWDTTEHRRPQWALAEDKEGQAMQECVRRTLKLREDYGALRRGWANVLHEDRPNGVVAFERVAEGEARIVCIINAGRGSWQGGEYGVYVGGGTFEELFCSQTEELGGWEGTISNTEGPKPSHDGKIYINLPSQSCLVFKQVD